MKRTREGRLRRYPGFYGLFYLRIDAVFLYVAVQGVDQVVHRAGPPYCKRVSWVAEPICAARRRSAGSAAVSPWPAVRVRTHRDRQRGSHRSAGRRSAPASSTTGPRPALMKMAEDFIWQTAPDRTDGESLRSGQDQANKVSLLQQGVSRSQ